MPLSITFSTFNYLFYRLFYSPYQRNAMQAGELRLSSGNKNFSRSQNKFLKKILGAALPSSTNWIGHMIKKQALWVLISVLWFVLGWD